MAEKFLSHFLVGIFFGAFGFVFLGLTLWRLVRLIRGLATGKRNRGKRPTPNGRRDETAEAEEPFEKESDRGSTNAAERVLREFLVRHVPEQNAGFLRVTSRCIAGSCLFGIVYTMLGARFLNHDVHQDYTIFHYVTHLTLLLLYFFVGWTGLLEVNGYLPRDALRAATSVALWGEAVLWYVHGTAKDTDIQATVHYAIAGIAGLTAVFMTMSVLVVALSGNYPLPATLSFALYLTALVGIVWQALWFVTVAFYIQGWLPLPSTGHAAALVVFEGLVLVFLCQLVAVALVRMHRSTQRNGGKHHETYRLVAGENGDETIPEAEDGHCNEELELTS